SASPCRMVDPKLHSSKESAGCHTKKRFGCFPGGNSPEDRPSRRVHFRHRTSRCCPYQSTLTRYRKPGTESRQQSDVRVLLARHCSCPFLGTCYRRVLRCTTETALFLPGSSPC